MADKLPPFFGIDLGKNKIKIAQIKYTADNKAQIETVSSVNSSFALISDESAKGVDDLARELQKTIKEANVPTKNCVISLSETNIFSRLLTLPKVKEEEVEESIHWALKPLVPIPLETLNISFLEIDSKKEGGQEMTNWYAVAAPKTLVDRCMNITKKAGLNLLAIETESLAIARLVSFTHNIPAGKNIMIIDLGSESTNFILARNSVVTFSQSISTGSNSMTKVIASDFNIDEVQAEQYKVAYGLDFSAGEGKIARAIEPLVQIILGEASRTLSYLREKIGGESISSIFICGGGAGLKGLDGYMKDKLGLETITVNTLSNFEVNANIRKNPNLMRNNLREFNVSLGLALKRY